MLHLRATSTLPWPYSIDQSMHVWLELQLQHSPGVAFTDAISRDCTDLQSLIKRLDHEDIITQEEEEEGFYNMQSSLCHA